jgi:hypothetical protein
MPPYSGLPAKDLDDLVAYLASLRAEATSVNVLREKGIR